MEEFCQPTTISASIQSSFVTLVMDSPQDQAHLGNVKEQIGLLLVIGPDVSLHVMVCVLVLNFAT